MAVIIGEWRSERRPPARHDGLERRLQPAPAAAGRGTGPPLPASAAEATWTAGISTVEGAALLDESAAAVRQMLKELV